MEAPQPARGVCGAARLPPRRAGAPQERTRVRGAVSCSVSITGRPSPSLSWRVRLSVVLATTCLAEGGLTDSSCMPNPGSLAAPNHLSACQACS